jgi:hypothetical protein
MTDTDQKKEDEVLKRMLATKPKPHKAAKSDSRVAKAQARD